MNGLRTAVVADHSAIMRIIEEARSFIASYGSDQWQDGYPEPELIASDIEAKVGYVFEDESGVHAYAAIVPGHEPTYDDIKGAWKTNDERYITVHRVAIDNTCRGKGIGKMILAKAEEAARAEHLNSVRADTHRVNLAMQGLMKKCGFVYCGDVYYVVTEGDPIRICFEKVLEEK